MTQLHRFSFAVLVLGLGCSPSKLVGSDESHAGTAGVSDGHAGQSDSVGGQAGAAGEGQGDAGDTSVAGGGDSSGKPGTGGHSATGGRTETGVGGQSAGEGGTVATCTKLNCLWGGRFLYQANRVWSPEDRTASEPLLESDYVATADGAMYLLSFSADGKAVVAARMGEDASTDNALGTLAKTTQGTAVYDLYDGWTGAQLTIAEGETFSAEMTLWGSGVPIVGSTRGTVESSTDYDNAGDTCGIPLASLYENYLPATYAEALADATATEKGCAGLRNGYCEASCDGWLTLEYPTRGIAPSIVTTLVYDPTTKQLAGFLVGPDSYGICRGKFPPATSDGKPGWDSTQMDLTDQCE